MIKEIKTKKGSFLIDDDLGDGDILSPDAFKQFTDHLQQEADSGKLDELFDVVKKVKVDDFSFRFVTK